jgi:hypothetical protein
VVTPESPSGHQWQIESGEHRAVIVEVGGGVRLYQHESMDYLDGYADDEIVLTPRDRSLRRGPTGSVMASTHSMGFACRCR